MKISRANKLPDREGYYWYMTDGALRLVQVEANPIYPLRWRLVLPYFGQRFPCSDLVSDTSPEHWSERVDFEEELQRATSPRIHGL